MKKRAILFDFDGTIANTIPGIMAAIGVIKERYHYPFSLEEAQDTIGKPLMTMAEILVGKKEAGHFVSSYLEEAATDSAHLFRFFQGASALLEYLRQQDIFIAVVTSKRRGSLMQNLERENAAHFFDLLITSDDTLYHKPHPAPVELALTTLGVEAEEAIMVGDSSYDILAGIGANVDTIAVTWGSTAEDELMKCNPTYVVEDFPELQALLQMLVSP